MTSIPEASQKGFADASSYDTHRPSYPLSAFNSLLQNLHIDGFQGAKIVDLAAGTGKLTELLADREEGYEIIAVEPNNAMRAELERKQLKGVTVVRGEASKMGVESQTADAVIVAQAFHWFANEESLEEIFRILVPGGTFGMIWNIEDYNAPKSWDPTTEREGKLKAIVWSSGNENPKLRHEQWKHVFENQTESTPLTIQAANPRFSLPLGINREKWTHWLEVEAIWERFHTLSQFAVLGGERLEATKREVFDALSGPDVEKRKDGKVALHGQTLAAWTTAIPGAPLKSGG